MALMTRSKFDMVHGQVHPVVALPTTSRSVGAHSFARGPRRLHGYRLANTEGTRAETRDEAAIVSAVSLNATAEWEPIPSSEFKRLAAKAIERNLELLRLLA